MSVAQLERRVDGSEAVSVGGMIKEARKRMGLTQAELGERANINVNSLAKYERAGEQHPDGRPAGVFPPWDKAHRLCKVLQMDAALLFAAADNDEDDFKRRELEGPSVANSERALELLIEAARLMGGKVTMRSEGSVPVAKTLASIEEDEWDEGPEPAGFTGSVKLDAVVELADQEGPNAEDMAQAIEEAEVDLRIRDVSELIDMALPLELPIETFPNEAELEGLRRREMRDQKRIVIERLVVAAVYGHVWENLSTKGFEQLSRDLGATLGLTPPSFRPYGDEQGVIDDKGWLLESEMDFRARALEGLRPRLLEALRLQDAPDLGDTNRYPLRGSDDENEDDV